MTPSTDNSSILDVLRTIQELPRLLTETRTRLKLTQYDVAESTGVSQARVSDVERGATNLRVSTLVQLVAWLAVAVSQPTPLVGAHRRPPTRG